MKIYNTLSHSIEEFIPINDKKVKMYTCGPTVYNFAHIGNLRTYIMEDILEKTLLYLGYEVKRVMNITDVGHLSGDSDTGEDKMVKSATEKKKTVMEIASYYTEAFFNDFNKLNIKKPEIIVPATSCIDLYIKMIEGLINKGYAYVTEHNVYFDTSKLKEYYVLTNIKEDELIVGARDDVTEDPDKRNSKDFVLWFTKSKFDNQELKWDSPWGIGYPGWHIECSCISLEHLGEYLDIHCGGVDNIFPHHTNEIAQTESYIGHKWCNYWVHAEFLNDSTGKMSKSKGEFLILDLLVEKGYNPLSYRLFCLGSHYRNQLMFTYESLDIAQNSYNKLKNRILNLSIDGEIDNEKIALYQKLFKEALSNDLNTSGALTILYDVLKDEELNNTSKIALIKAFDQVLSLDLLKKENIVIDEDLKQYIEEMIEKRNVAKKNKDYALADNIRDELNKKGIEIKDTKEKTMYSIKEV